MFQIWGGVRLTLVFSQKEESVLDLKQGGCLIAAELPAHAALQAPAAPGGVTAAQFSPPFTWFLQTAPPGALFD